MNVVTVERLAKLLNEQIAKGNGKKKILIGVDDEGNGFRPMYYEVSPTEGNVCASTLHGVTEKDALENYIIIG